MANSLNKVILIGNLGNDPEIRNTNDGKQLANFSVATSESWKDRSTGEKKERTEWHRVVVFNEGLVSIIKNYAKKGSKVYIEGSLQTRKWTSNTGEDRYTTEVILQNFNSAFILLDSKHADNNMTAPMTSSKNNSQAEFKEQDLDDEIPFY